VDSGCPQLNKIVLAVLILNKKAPTVLLHTMRTTGSASLTVKTRQILYNSGYLTGRFVGVGINDVSQYIQEVPLKIILSENDSTRKYRNDMRKGC
jgi:hypothetical protein